MLPTVASTTLMPIFQVLIFLQENLKATPEALGDPRKESPEELAERHERVVAASLLALSSLLDLLVSMQQHENVTGTLWGMHSFTNYLTCTVW